MTHTVDFVAKFGDAVDAAATRVWPRYRQHLGIDDVKQAIWVWLVSNEKLADAMDAGFLARRLRTAAERYCRKEKAQRAGYEVIDEYFYSEKQLARIIFDAFDNNATPPAETYRADELYAEWTTEVSDVRAALRRKTFPLHHYRVLWEFVEGRRTEYKGDVRFAVLALQRQLGGSKPR